MGHFDFTYLGVNFKKSKWLHPLNFVALEISLTASPKRQLIFTPLLAIQETSRIKWWALKCGSRTLTCPRARMEKRENPEFAAILILKDFLNTALVMLPQRERKT